MKVDKPEIVSPSRVQGTHTYLRLVLELELILICLVLSNEPKRDSSTLLPNTVKNTAGLNVEKPISSAEEMVIFWGKLDVASC